MQKIFEEYGNVIVTAIAIVALIGLVAFMAGGENGGVIGNALQRQVTALVQGAGDSSDGSIDDSISGTVPPANSGNQPSIGYTLEEIENNEYLYAVGATKPEYVVVSFNEDYSAATVLKNGPESDGIIKDFTGYDDGESFSPLTIHSSTLKKVTFKEGITAIGETTCFELSNVTSISLPDSVKRIGMGAFGYCSSLSSIVLPSSLDAIEASTFVECDSLTNVVIPDGLVSIDDYAFGDCSALEAIIIPPSVTSIHYDAFRSSAKLKTIKGVAGSYAETFANSRGYTFVAI